MKTLGVGMVGYGFIGKVHTYAYQSLPFYYNPVPARIKLVGVCTSRPETARKAAEHGGYEFHTTDYRDLLAREDIHIINCCTPNCFHKDLVIDALRAGKHIYCEKPLTRNLAEAREIWQVAKESDVIHQMSFEYRFFPATMRAKQLVEDGFLGQVFHFRAGHLHSGYIDPQRPISWRLDVSQSGGGALFDLGSHALDLVRHLLGDYKSVSATLDTFFKERPLPGGGGEMGKVEVDDLALLRVKMENGAWGLVEASRLATGVNDELRVEIHGSKGALRFNLMDPNWLEVYDAREVGEPMGGNRGFKRIETVQRYPAPAVQPAPKVAVGWIRAHMASMYDFVCNVVEGRLGSPNLYDGYKIQEIMEAVCLSSRSSREVSLDEFAGVYPL